MPNTQYINAHDQRVADAARGKKITMPPISANGEKLVGMKTCHCGTGYCTPQCPTCTPTLRYHPSHPRFRERTARL